MSTEKSLLTYESVKHLLNLDVTRKCVQVPMGIDISGALQTVELEIGKSSAHLLLCGQPGSGRYKALHFILKSMLEMYGKDIAVSCICGTAYTLPSFRKVIQRSNSMVSTHLTAVCDTEESLNKTLNYLLDMVKIKQNTVPEIIIFDNIDKVEIKSTKKFNKVLAALLDIAPNKNVHLINSVEVHYSLEIPLLEQFGVKCATRVSTRMSNQLFGSDIASRNGGTRNYGDLTYIYNNEVSRVEVPFCHFCKPSKN